MIFIFPKISLRVLKEASDDQQNDDPDGKRRDDGHGLQIRHGVIGKDQGDGQKHQQNRPEQLHIPVWLLAGWQSLVGIGGSHHG